MFTGQLSLVVVLLVGICLVGGLALLRKAVRGSTRCRHCGRKNPGNAKFCATCGKSLT